MEKNQRFYTPEFKQQIVELHNKPDKGIIELSNEYGIPKGTISTWVKNLSPVQMSDTETISLKEFKALQKSMKELEIENEILKISYSHIRQKSIAEYESFIQANLDKHTVKQLCKVLKFPRSTYYAAVNYVPSKREQAFNEFSNQVLSIYPEFKKRYVAIKIQKELNFRNIPCSVKRFQRHMRPRYLMTRKIS